MRPVRILIITLICLLPVLGSAGNAKIDDLVVFGDSLSDPGNAYALLGEQSVAPFELIPAAPYAIGGHHFSNGRTWVEQLGHEFGVNVGPAYSVAGFNNYAIGSARARSVGQIYLSMQVTTFLGRYGGRAPAGNLYVLFIGGNDIRDAIQSFATDPTGQAARAIITDALAAIADNLGSLAGAGARQFLVLNAPDLSLVPAIRLQADPALSQLAQSLSASFNQGLLAVLTNLESMHSVNIKTVDIFSLLNLVANDPDSQGFSEVEFPCINPGVVQQAICAQPNEYLFWDGIHPTRTGHKLIANTVMEQYPARKKPKQHAVNE